MTYEDINLDSLQEILQLVVNSRVDSLSFSYNNQHKQCTIIDTSEEGRVIPQNATREELEETIEFLKETYEVK